MTAGTVSRFMFDVTCPACGGDLEVLANGKPYRCEVGSVVRCSEAKCRAEFALRVHLMPNGARSTNLLSHAIKKENP